MNKKTLAVWLATAMLAACGGSGDNNDNGTSAAGEPADKYVGTWDAPCYSEDGLSANATIVLTKGGAHSVSGTSTLRVFNNTSCSGNPVASQDFPANITIDGTTQASGKTADKVTETSLGESGKELLYVDGNRLFASQEGSALDGQGYPTQLDLATVQGIRR
ncbi:MULTISPECIES: hypothetical protein [Hydrogenophaga]|uniref:Lipocalin-like domain-containing protein n=1 Tax=Hydrogenophaga electricum TaxID=1230953 RepID=A0ABQ6CAY4_9BURK|nr:MULTISPECIES: hypothetical protein [Hydrogenophaga]GLS15342.1 hypothetical protein GCM10007935_27770 [Hydrogenophaga electricum]